MIADCSKPKKEIKEIVRKLYSCAKCADIVLEQLAEKVKNGYDGNWDRLNLEYLKPAEIVLMQLRISVQGSQQQARDASGQSHRRNQQKPYQSATLDHRTPPTAKPSAGSNHASTTLPHHRSSRIAQPSTAPGTTTPPLLHNGNFQRNYQPQLGTPADPPPGDKSRLNALQGGQPIESPPGPGDAADHVQCQDSWPMCVKEKVIVHMNEPSKESLRAGDSYFCVRQNGQGRVDVVLRHINQGSTGVKDYTLEPDGNTKHAKIFDTRTGMDHNNSNSTTTTGYAVPQDLQQCNSDEELVTLLSQCVVAAECGLERMTWDQVKLSRLRSVSGGGGRNRGGDVRGTLTNQMSGQGHQQVNVDGCRDRRGGSVIVMFCRHHAWEEEGFNATQLAKLLLYYYTIISEERRSLGLTIIVDAQGTSLSTLNVLLQTLYNLETSQPQSIHIVHVLADRVAQSLLFKSSVFRPQMNIKIDLVTSVETLYKFVEKCMLPVEIGGQLIYQHKDWVNFRMILDPFLEDCRCVARLLLRVMHDMTLTSTMPDTSKEAGELLEQHENCVSKALEEPMLKSLQNTGEDTLTMIKEEVFMHGSQPDYKESYDSAKTLFCHVKESMFRLVKVADDKLHRLEHCIQLRKFEEKVTSLMDWLCCDGEDLLQQYSTLSDNLKGIHTQQGHFQQAYFSAMSQVEKGNALLEEASMLSQSDELEQVTGIKEISKELKGRIKGFSGRLEEVRENIENTGHCYKMLDQCYEWALEAMKYVASMKMDKEMESKDIDKLLTSLEGYMSQHPPITQNMFANLESTATTVDNDRLREQCKVARSRCLETEQLLELRHSTLKKAKEQLKHEQEMEQERRDSLTSLNSSCHGNNPLRSPVSSSSLNSSSISSIPVRSPTSSHNFGPIVYRDRGSLTSSGGPGGNRYWPKETCSTPVGPSLDYVLRRRSYAGKPSAPVYSPSVAAFKENLQGLSMFEYEEYLFNEGLITEDMSDRIVTSLPKGLSDSTLKSSRESLRGSQENVTDGNTTTASNPPEAAGTSKSAHHQGNSSHSSSSSSFKSIASRTSSLMVSLSKHSKPQRKVMRRAATSCPTTPDSAAVTPTTTATTSSSTQHSASSSSSLRDNSGDVRDRRLGSSKTLSMVTAQSSESLPGLPEDDSLDNSAQAERRQTWTPLPPNPQSHRAAAGGAHHHPFVSQSMADLRLTEEDVKRRRQLQLIMTEMIHTEKDYVSALQLIQDHYIPETSRDDVPQDLRGKRNVIFGNIEKIYEFHSQYFLAELQSCVHNPYQIGQCFLNHEAEFFLYALYNKNKPKSDGLMLDYGRRFFLCKQTELGDKMDLSSYLLKPVQRMGKYSLLLKQIIKECPTTEPEYADLRTAYEMVKFQLRHGNDLLAMDCLTGADVNLQEQGMLLRQETFMVYRGRRKALRHVFLFEDMVVFSKTKRTSLGKEIYVYKNSIKLSDLGLTENTGDSRYKFEIWFRKRKDGDTYTLQAPTAETKAEWVREISRLLWQQAIKNRDRRLNENVRMGAGHKPCIDLKPSADNIQDRFVNCSLNSRLPRVRNSIAVFNSDQFKNGSKRPHSLISISSSTSSSGSSGMYSGGPLGITIESPYESLYEASDVPKATDLPRSATMCSNESGIVADMSSSNPSSPVKEDAYTQTTLKRPGKTVSQTQQQGMGMEPDTGTSLSLLEPHPTAGEQYPEASNA